MCVPTQFPVLPEQQELLHVGPEVSDLFIWPLSMRLMYPITSGLSLFSSFSPAAKWMIKLERSTRRDFVESAERWSFTAVMVRLVYLFNCLVNVCLSSISSIAMTFMLTYTASLEVWFDCAHYYSLYLRLRSECKWCVSVVCVSAWKWLKRTW